MRFFNEQLHFRQANVALNLTKSSETKNEEEEKRIRKIEEANKSTPSTPQSITGVIKEEKKKEEESNPEATEQPKPQVAYGRNVDEQTQSSLAAEQQSKQEDEKMDTSSPKPSPVVEEEMDEDPGEINIVSLTYFVELKQTKTKKCTFL